MKFKSFFAIAAMALMAIVSCEKPDEKVEAPASISADKESLEFVAKDAPSQTIKLTATRDWRVDSQPDWVVLDKSEGKGANDAQTITVSVEDNDGFNRSGDLVFSIGIRKAAVKISQAGSKGELVAEGEGTQESPFNVLGVIKYVQELGADVESEGEVYVKGKVSLIEEAYSFSYGNGTFFITDDGTVDTPKFYCYRVYYLGGAKWTIVNPVLAVGDEVVVLSKVYNYKGNTPETVNLGSTKPGGPYNGKLYSLNGSTEAQVTEPDFSNAPEKTVAEFIAAADKNNFYKLHGTVSGFNSQYCSFDLKDESDSSIYVYSVANADEWKTKISNNAEVKLAGAYDYYESKKQHEVVSAWIMEVIEHEQIEFEDLTIAEFIRKGDKNIGYRLSGTVTGFTVSVDNSGNPVMSFDLTDNTGSVKVYGFKAGEYDKWHDKISNRGTATVHGVYAKYEKNGAVTHEVMEAVVESFEPAPEQTVFEEISIAEFIAKADTAVGYKLHGTVSSLSVKSDKKQMEFNLTDESGSTVKAYGFKVGQFEEWNEKLANGGTAVLHGVYKKFVKDGAVTHEVMETVIDSFEAAPVVEEQAEGDGTLANPYNVLGVKAYIDSEGYSKDKNVYVAGKICQIDNAYDVEHGTAQFWISSDGSLAASQFEAFSVKYLENKKWQEGQKALKINDDVILYGKVTLYKDKNIYETTSGAAYLYSLNGETVDDSPIFGVENPTISVAASATSATINVTGNVAWTATSTCALTPEAGNGAGAITVNFDANEDTEAGKEYTVTVTTEAEVAVKSYTVTIKQGKKIAGGDPVTISVSMLDMAKKYNATTNGTQVVSLELAEGIVMSVNKKGNNGKFYENGAEWRLYQGDSAQVTITATDHELVSVKFNYNQSNGGILKSDSGTVDSGKEVSVSGSSVTFSVASSTGKTNGQVKMKSVEITYL